MSSFNGPSKLFVGDIGDNRKSDLNRVFAKYGEISTIYVDENKHFAFVEFTSSSDAQRALRHANNKTVNGSRLRVEYAKSSRTFRDNRRPSSRECSPVSALYNHLQVTANRLPSIQAIRQSYYQHRPPVVMTNSAVSRGRSLTPPSFKQNARLSSTHHLRAQNSYSMYYPHHSAVYSDSNYYRTYGDPYFMQRLPPSTFFTPLPSSPTQSSSHTHRSTYSSSGLRRSSPEMSYRRTRRSHSRSRNGLRNSASRKDRSSRERKQKRRSSSSSVAEQSVRGPRTPPTSYRTKKRSRSGSDPIILTAEQKLPATSFQEKAYENRQFNSERFQDNYSHGQNSKRKKQQ